MARVLTFLSDYGHDDDFVGVCHGVIARTAPDARVIDITHGIPRHDIRSGALALRRALPYFPAGVHLAVVDPEVGAERRAVALRTAEEDRVLVGPDNGLLLPAAEALRRRRRGGRDHARRKHRLEPDGGDVPRPRRVRPRRRAPRGGRAARRGRRADRARRARRAEMPRGARARTAQLVAHALGLRPLRHVMLDVEHAELGRARAESSATGSAIND